MVEIRRVATSGWMGVSNAHVTTKWAKGERKKDEVHEVYMSEEPWSLMGRVRLVGDVGLMDAHYQMKTWMADGPEHKCEADMCTFSCAVDQVYLNWISERSEDESQAVD